MISSSSTRIFKYLSGALLGLVVFAMAVVAIPSSRYQGGLTGYGSGDFVQGMLFYHNGAPLLNNCLRHDSLNALACNTAGSQQLIKVGYGGTPTVTRLACHHGASAGDNSGDSLEIGIYWTDSDGANDTSTTPGLGVTIDLTDNDATFVANNLSIQAPFADGNMAIEIITLTDADVSVTDAEFNCTVYYTY